MFASQPDYLSKIEKKKIDAVKETKGSMDFLFKFRNNKFSCILRNGRLVHFLIFDFFKLSSPLTTVSK